MVGGTYYVVSGGHYDPSVTWISLAYAFGPTAVLFGKHTDKLEADRAKASAPSPSSSASRSRASASSPCSSSSSPSPSPSSPAASSAGPSSWSSSPSPACAAPSPCSCARARRPAPDFPAHIWPTYLVAYAFRHNRVFGLLFILGLLASLALPR
jgi:1,4-dihydroxy-2-naphthoate octaprenyltransferase